MNYELNQKGTAYRTLESLPIFGRSIALVWDHTGQAIAESGLVIGLLRGAGLGLIMGALMLVLAEGLPIGWSVVKSYLDIRILQPIFAQQREDAEQRTIKWKHDHTLMLMDLYPWKTDRPIHYYLVSKPKEAEILDRQLTTENALEHLAEWQADYYQSATVKTLPTKSTVWLFMFQNGSFGEAITNVPNKGRCVFGSLTDGSVILIPERQYLEVLMDRKGPFHK